MEIVPGRVKKRVSPVMRLVARSFIGSSGAKDTSDESFVVIDTELALVESPTRINGSAGSRKSVVPDDTVNAKNRRITEKKPRVNTS